MQRYTIGNRFFRVLLLLTTIHCQQACTIGPDFEQPAFTGLLPPKWQQASTDQFTSKAPPAENWWLQFHDPGLNALIDKLHSSNIPLAKARERIVEVNARQGVIGAEKRLQLAAALGYTHVDTGDEAVSLQGIPPGKSLDIYSTGLSAGWEADLWGRTARMLEAAEQDIRISQVDYQALLVSLAAELSLVYFESRTLETLMEMVNKSLELQHQTRTLAQSKYDAGNGSAFDVTRTDLLISATRARLPELQRRLVVSRNRINLLLGQPPQRAQPVPGKLPTVPRLIGTGLPADLLTRRPDINRALYAYHGAVARIGAAAAEQYPTLTISGTLTLSSDSAAGLFTGTPLIYSLGPGMRFPILTGKRIESNIAVRRSQAEQARLNLEQQILQAVTEVENSSNGVIRTQQRVSDLEQAEKCAAKNVRLAEERYQAGLGNLYDVLDTQQQLLTMQESLLLAKQQALAETVALYRALGGGWQQAAVRQNNAEQ